MCEPQISCSITGEMSKSRRSVRPGLKPPAQAFLRGGCSFSMSKTSRPFVPARPAQAAPAGPPPTTIRSRAIGEHHQLAEVAAIPGFCPLQRGPMTPTAVAEQPGRASIMDSHGMTGRGTGSESSGAELIGYRSSEPLLTASQDTDTRQGGNDDWCSTWRMRSCTISH